MDSEHDYTWYEVAALGQEYGYDQYGEEPYYYQQEYYAPLDVSEVSEVEHSEYSDVLSNEEEEEDNFTPTPLIHEEELLPATDDQPADKGLPAEAKKIITTPAATAAEILKPVGPEIASPSTEEPKKATADVTTKPADPEVATAPAEAKTPTTTGDMPKPVGTETGASTAD